MKERSLFWDNFKGILIVLVVFGHFIYESATNLHNSFANDIFTFIYIFHMPAFVFCSGYLSKSDNTCKAKSIAKLSICYVVFNTLLMLYCCLYKETRIQILTPYASAWYILSLIIWRSVIRYVAKIKWILPIAFVTALLIGFWGEFSNVFALSRTVAFFPFFLMGYRINEDKLQKHLSARTPIKVALGAVVALVVGASVFVLVRKTSIQLGFLTMQPYTGATQIVYRGVILACAIAVIATMMYVVPNIKVPFLSKIGRNSLFIYLFHRFVTFGFDLLFPHSNYTKLYLVYAAVATCITVIVLGTDKINNWFNRVINDVVDGVVEHKNKLGKRFVAALLAVSMVILAVPFGGKLLEKLNSLQPKAQVNVASVTDNSIKLSFVGELSLLKDQVESAYDNETGEYHFDAAFEYAEKYLSEADLAIGVLEGPMAGEEKGYTTSDFYDKAKLNNNFPDSFAYAIKDAGIDLVTTANNHLFDMGVEGVMRTLDVLDAAGLAHTGSYRNIDEKNQTQIIDVKGIKIAILSYSWYFNYYPNKDLLEDYPYITSILPDENDPFFPQLMAEIENDFANAKAAEADLIVVVPHMGTQFSHEADAFQVFWNKQFSELGADVILCAHAQAVQPIEQIGETIVVNCPGKFLNSYIPYDGDANSVVEIYINKETKKPTATAIIPVYMHELRSGYFRAIPVYDVLTQNELYEQMSNLDLERIAQVQELVTDVMLGETIAIDAAQPRYFYINGQYCPYTYTLLNDMTAYRDTQLYKLVDSASNVVCIGDCITKGSHNGGHPWYQPIMSYFEDVSVQNISDQVYTASEIIKNFSDEILKSTGDLYIVAIGMNDIRYLDPQRCAMTPEAYVDLVADITELILQANQNAQIVLISPWVTLDNDRISKLQHVEKLVTFELYSAALETFADERSYCFIDPNQTLLTFFETHQRYQYTSDGVRPNETKGVDLYSWAVMESSK